MTSAEPSISLIPESFEPRTDTSIYPWMRSRLFVPLALAAITLAMFAGVLFLPGDRVLSGWAMDTSNIFVYWRQFGFDQIRAGHLPLWLPNVYSGLPFLGGFEEALLYPPNWLLYLTLPLAKAINFDFALHVFLFGFFTALWAGHYKLHPLAMVFAGCGAMFAQPFFLAILAGHLPHLDSMAWAPLILLTIDSLLDQPSLNWILVGIFALSMQILAGYPPVMFSTVVGGAIYAAARLFRANRPLGSVLALSAVGLGAVLICAGQLGAGLQASAEGTRNGGTSFNFASSGSLSPDALLTMVMPDFFGNGRTSPIWSSAFPNLFFGLTGLIMAIVGMRVKWPHRGAWFVTMLLLLWIALGHRTPLFALLYRDVPGFNLFRQPAGYSLTLTLFMAMLSGFGMDAVIRSRSGAKTTAVVLLLAGLALALFAALAHSGASATFNGFWQDLLQTFDHFSEPAVLRRYDPAFLAEVGHYVTVPCLIAAGTCIVLAGLLFARSAYPGAAYVLAVFGIAEAFLFSSGTLATFHLAATVPAQLRQFIAAHPGDYRILDTDCDGPFGLPVANSAVPMGANAVSGYDPLAPRRYAEFIYYSQGRNPDDADMIMPVLPLRRISPMFRLLRLRYIIADNRISSVYYFPRNQTVQMFAGYPLLPDLGPLPHVLLVDGWDRIEHRNDIFAALNAPTFDGAKTAILESAPNPAPAPGPDPGTVRLLGTTSDSLTIAADLTRPELLLVTDGYSRYWRAVALHGSSQSEYQVMPADYTLMAVPLASGHHLLRLEYAPSGWMIGRWISLASVLLYIVAVIWWLLGDPRLRYETIDA